MQYHAHNRNTTQGLLPLLEIESWKNLIDHVITLIVAKWTNFTFM